jgi:isoleucyl-tRNA synthetase
MKKSRPPLPPFSREGADAWFSRDLADFIGPDACCACGSVEFVKEEDILDVWFDSGVSFAAVLEQRPELQNPADLYLEGSDQHRGWFQSALLAAVGTRGVAPYRAVLTHGFVVDGKGKKMSKSIGNVIAPAEIIKQHGAEILRLWAASEDYRDDIRISDNILKQLADAYRKIRNTIRFLLGNLHDFDPAAPRTIAEGRWTSWIAGCLPALNSSRSGPRRDMKSSSFTRFITVSIIFAR